MSRNHCSHVNSKPSASAFLEKLYEILLEPSNHPYIAWQADGTSFLIKKVPELQEIVLPKYFKHNNLQSFVRQLNMYDTDVDCSPPVRVIPSRAYSATNF